MGSAKHTPETPTLLRTKLLFPLWDLRSSAFDSRSVQVVLPYDGPVMNRWAIVPLQGWDKRAGYSRDRPPRHSPTEVVKGQVKRQINQG